MLKNEIMRVMLSYDARLKRTDPSGSPAVAATSIAFAQTANLLCVTSAVGFEVYSCDGVAISAALNKSVDDKASFDPTAYFTSVYSAKFPELPTISAAFLLARFPSFDYKWLMIFQLYYDSSTVPLFIRKSVNRLFLLFSGALKSSFLSLSFFLRLL